MELKNKIIAGLTGLGIATSVAVVGLDRACYFDAEVLKVSDQKLCFQTKEDWKLYKDAKLSQYKLTGNNLFLWTDEGEEFFAVVNHELKKKSIEIKDFDKNKDALSEIIKIIK